MRILIFLFLVSSSLFYYGNAADNMNQIKTIPAGNPRPVNATSRNRRDVVVGGLGGEMEQDPNDPKYQQMAEDLVYNNLRIRKEDIRNIKVISVTTQVVSGIITRLEVQITLVSGISDQCKFQVWEQPWANVKHVTYECLGAALGNKKLLSANIGTPRPEQIRDPKDPKYHKLAEASIDYWFKTPGYKPFEKEDVDKIDVTNVKAQIGSNIKNHIYFYVIVNNTTYECISNMTETPWNPNEIGKFSEVTCALAFDHGPTQVLQNLKNPMGSVLKLKKMTIPGGETYEKPWDPKYKKLANRSFQKYQSIHNLNYKVDSIFVDTVTSQVVAGFILRINFHVFTITGTRFMCKSKIIEAPKSVDLDIKVDCSKIGPGFEKEQDPKDPQYKILADRSFEWYQKKHKQVDVKSINVNRVTTQVVAGTIIHINFIVYPIEGNIYKCKSKIFEGLGRDHIFKFNVNCTKYDETGREEVQDPDDPKYQNLAKESFQWYQKTHPNVKAHVKRIKVNRVTTQIVAGTITRINFRVYPTRGSQLTCYSKIIEGLEPLPKPDFDVKCNSIIGGEEEQDPDDPKYHKLAELSFEWYQNQDKNLKVHVKSIKVNRAITQEVAGTITRIDFRVYPTRGSQLTCHSKIFEGLGPHPIPDFDVNCYSKDGGEEEQDPDDPKYLVLAKESFKWYQKSHKNVKVHVKGIEVNRVTTQVVAGTITRMDFRVYPTRGRQLTCHSEIFEGLGPHPYPNFDVKCNSILGGEEEQDPDDPKYLPLAKQSFEWYLKSHPEFNVHVKKIKVYDVTTQVVAGMIIRINFRVHPTRGTMFMCRSKIWRKPRNDKSFDVSCNALLDGEVEEDPNDPQYKKLAQESFLWYQKSHKNVGYAKSINIDSVTSQVVAGTIIRIYFSVKPSRGSQLNCFSKIFEELGLHPKSNFDVSCAGYDGGEEEQDPDEPRFLQLAKESFRKYQETYPHQLFAIRKMQVTRATTQIVAGVITRLNFYVITTESAKYVCNSKINEQAWKDRKIITVNCNHNPLTGGNKKLSLNMSPKSDTEDLVCNAIKEYLRNEDPSLLNVNRCDTKSVTTVRTRVAKQRIIYYQVDAFTQNLKGDSAFHNCSVLTGSWFGNKPFSTKCIKRNWLLGRREWADPTDKKYLSYAEKSLQLHLEKSSEVVGPRDYKKYDIIVTFVTKGLRAGYVFDIDFFARWVHDRDDDPTVLLCNSKHWDKLDGNHKILHVKCAYVSWDRKQIVM